MKKLFTIIVLLASLQHATAQIGSYNGKPRYSVRAVRAGVDIGNIELELYPAIAPKHVRNWDSLVFEKFLDTTLFHRVVPGFVIQGGDPNTKHGPKSTWGFGQAWQKTVDAEFNPISHVRGVLSAARDNDINSANSQFFICVAAATSLDNQYTAYGKVTSGISFVDNIVASPRDGNDVPNQNIAMYITRIADDTTRLATSANIIQPADMAQGISANYTFKWDALPGALIYEFELSKNSNFTTLDTIIKTAKTSITGVNLTPGGLQYYWRLQANNGGHKTASATRSFTTGTFPPALHSPDQNAVLANNEVVFVWETVPTASSYKIQIATNPNFTLSSIQQEVDSIPGTIINTIFATVLTPNKKHFWRVASEVNGNAGAYSASRTLTTGGFVGVDLKESGNLRVYPNPVGRHGILDVRQGTKNYGLSTKYQGQIFSIDGRLILTPEIIDGRIDVSKLEAGIYFLKTENGVAKFLIQ